MRHRAGRQPTNENISELPEGLPEVPIKLAEWLAERYAPRCWDPSFETEANHHVFRGASALSESLLHWAKLQAVEDLGEEDLEAINGAENAQKEANT